MIQVKKSFYSSLDRGIPPSGDLSVKPQQAQGYCAGLPPSGRLFIALVLRACPRCNSRSNFGTKNLLFGFLVNHLLRKLHLRCSGTRAKVNRARRGLAPPSLIERPQTTSRLVVDGGACPLLHEPLPPFSCSRESPLRTATRGNSGGQLGGGQLAGATRNSTLNSDF